MDETLTPLTMPTKTKTSARKGKKKKPTPRIFHSVDEVNKAYFPKKYREDMKAIKDRLTTIENRAEDQAILIEQHRSNTVTAFRNNGALQEEQDKRLTALEQAAKPTDPPPAEKWVPEVGEWVALKGESKLIQVTEVKYINDRSSPPCAYGKNPDWGAYVHNLRKPSEAEIAEHKRSEEARLKSEQAAKELAMPLEFGTRVKFDDGREMRVACPWMNPNTRKYALVEKDEDDELAFYTVTRDRFTVIP